MKYDLEFVNRNAAKRFAQLEHINHFYQGRQGERRLFSLEGVVVASGARGGCFAAQKLIKWSNFWGGEYAQPERYVGQDDQKIFYLGMFYGCWGHCITDNLRHIWPIVRNKLPRGLKLAYTTSAINEKLPNNFFALLERCGIQREDLLCVSTPTKFKEVWFAEPSYWYDGDLQARYYTTEFLDTIDMILGKDCVEASNIQSKKKIYLSRAGWRTSKPDFGENNIESAFHSAGYEIVHPEELSLVELIGMLSQCNCLAATEGSISHNALFLPSKSKLIVIRKADYINDVQMTINQIRDLNVKIIDAFRDEFLAYPKEPWRGPFFLYVSKGLAEFLHVSNAKFPMALYFCYFLSFLKMRIRVVLSFVKHNIFCRR